MFKCDSDPSWAPSNAPDEEGARYVQEWLIDIGPKNRAFIRCLELKFYPSEWLWYFAPAKCAQLLNLPTMFDRTTLKGMLTQMPFTHIQGRQYGEPCAQIPFGWTHLLADWRWVIKAINETMNDIGMPFTWADMTPEMASTMRVVESMSWEALASDTARYCRHRIVGNSARRMKGKSITILSSQVHLLG